MDLDLNNVYDAYYPSPISLKQLASISVALELKRREINHHRETNSLGEYELRNNISPSALEPLVPSNIFKDIKKYTGKIGESIDRWLQYHCETLIDFHRPDANEILRDFDDFVCDFEVKIHPSRTAERMMTCDRFSIDEKFKIACTYSFENDIVRIWPSVSARVNLDDIFFGKHPILYYWICRLTNQLDKVRQFDYMYLNGNVEKIMLWNTRDSHWTCRKYFWDRLDPADRFSIILPLSRYQDWVFSRYMLAKLDEQELDKYMAERGNLLLPILIKFPINLLGILPTWILIKNKISVDGFLDIAREIFKQETNPCFSEVWDAYVSWELWKGIPNNAKQKIIREVLPDTSLFVRDTRNSRFRIVSFLLAALSDAPIEVRSDFWRENWRNLIVACKTNDLSSLMNLCFKDETEIIQFKEATLSKYENIRPQCSGLLSNACFQELKKFIDFCCSSEQTGRELKLNLLNNDFELNSLHMLEVELFDEFIKDVFENDDEVRSFKIKLSSLIDTDESVKISVVLGHFRLLANFIDKFVVSKKKAAYLKKRYFPNVLRNQITSGRVPMSIKDDYGLSQFMQWCFDNNEQDIEKFKTTLRLDKFLEVILRREATTVKEFRGLSNPHRKCREKYPSKLDEFFDWYFTNSDPEAVENLKLQCVKLFELFLSDVSQEENR